MSRSRSNVGQPISRSRSEEQRLLSAEEYEFVSKTRQPTLKDLAAPELADLVSCLRERRDRARVNPVSDQTGIGARRDLLGAAFKRANKESERRQGAVSAKNELVANAHKALAMKQSAEEQVPDKPSSKTPNDGMRSVPFSEAPTASLDAEGQRVVLERSRKVR